jgi:hypothetical protein
MEELNKLRRLQDQLVCSYTQPSMEYATDPDVLLRRYTLGEKIKPLYAEGIQILIPSELG